MATHLPNLRNASVSTSNNTILLRTWIKLPYCPSMEDVAKCMHSIQITCFQTKLTLVPIKDNSFHILVCNTSCLSTCTSLDTSYLLAKTRLIQVYCHYQFISWFCTGLVYTICVILYDSVSYLQHYSVLQDMIFHLIHNITFSPFYLFFSFCLLSYMIRHLQAHLSCKSGRTASRLEGSHLY